MKTGQSSAAVKSAKTVAEFILKASRDGSLNSLVFHLEPLSSEVNAYLTQCAITTVGLLVLDSIAKKADREDFLRITKISDDCLAKLNEFKDEELELCFPWADMVAEQMIAEEEEEPEGDKK